MKTSFFNVIKLLDSTPVSPNTQEVIEKLKSKFSPSYGSYNFVLNIEYKNPHQEFIESIKNEGLGEVVSKFADPDLPNRLMMFAQIKAYLDKQYIGFMQYEEESFFYIIPLDYELHEKAFDYVENYLKSNYL